MQDIFVWVELGSFCTFANSFASRQWKRSLCPLTASIVVNVFILSYNFHFAYRSGLRCPSTLPIVLRTRVLNDCPYGVENVGRRWGNDNDCSQSSQLMGSLNHQW
eukprot:gb/GECG01001131.1/.p1 GENE.gb/GECG01001131.1/~~gb/GECG01001131.1/.p1  ORF type:complete len:105 (+),score=2.65 gb/GECG01001131.1/:1-315(+)